MQRKVLCVVVIVAVVVPAGFAAAQQSVVAPASKIELALVQHLQKDPLAAGVVRVEDPAVLWDKMVDTLKKFVPEGEEGEIDNGLKEVDEKLGVSLRNDILANLGPEIGGVVDLPPIDMLAGLFMSETSEGIATALGQIGIVCQVRDPERFNQVLWLLAEKAGAEVTEEGSLVHLSFVPEENNPEMKIGVFYGFEGKLLAIGFAAEWVTTSLAPRAEGQGLADGEDFARIAVQVDASADAFYYFNLPKVQEMIRVSEMAQGAIAADEDVAPLANILLDPKWVPTGLTSTFQLDDHGMRRVTYGPVWMAGGLQMGIIAGVAMPNLMAATSRGRQKRTMADMRTAGTCVEAYAVDNMVYPSTNGEWVDLAEIEDKLSPDYVKVLPTTDGWGNAFRYRSDGETYHIVSPAKDGTIDKDWTTVEEEQANTDFGADIVFANGFFLSFPSAIQRD